jgi:hypothetical protein
MCLTVFKYAHPPTRDPNVSDCVVRVRCRGAKAFTTLLAHANHSRATLPTARRMDLPQMAEKIAELERELAERPSRQELNSKVDELQATQQRTVQRSLPSNPN